MTVTPVAGWLATFVRKDTSPEAISTMSAALKRINDHDARDLLRSTLRYEYPDLDAKGTENFVTNEIRLLDQILKNVPVQKIIR